MEVTKVEVHKVDREGSTLKAYASITFDDCFIVKNIRIIQTEEKFIVAMPNRKKPDGTSDDVAHPLNKETRIMIDAKILEEYNKPETEE